MSVLTAFLMIGKVAGSATAIGLFLLGVWKYAIVPAQQIGDIAREWPATKAKIDKIQHGLGENGTEPAFTMLHRLDEWRVEVNEALIDIAQSVRERL